MSEFTIDEITNLTPFNGNINLFKEMLSNLEEKHTIRVIDGSNYLIQMLEVSTFDNFQNLIHLNLSNNALTEIEIGVFDSLLNLETINLSNNLLSLINNSIFRKNLKLQEINLENNILSEINSSVFWGLNKLLNLNLSNNQIKSVDYLCLRSIQLKKLDLSYNCIKNIDSKAFVMLNELIDLRLNNNQITTLNDQVFEILKNIEYIDLSNNIIENLEKNLFFGLMELKTLNLSSNSLKYLDQQLFLSNFVLTDLDLSDNNFGILVKHLFIGCPNLKNLKLKLCGPFNPMAFENLFSLEIFELYSTYDQKIDCSFFLPFNKDTIRNMKLVFKNAHFHMTTILNFFRNLESLHIEFLFPVNKTSLINFPREMNQLSNLRYLTLKHINRLIMITQYTNHPFLTVKIEYLDLSGIQNQSIDKLIERLPLLKYLNLSNSNIIRIEISTMERLIHLEQLILKNSKIATLPFNLFKNNVNLKVLDFENCLIHKIDNFVFRNLVNLEFLNLKTHFSISITASMLHGVPSTANVLLHEIS